jgi:hypothetical protein
MYTRLKPYLILLLLLTSSLTKAQQFGGNPPGIKWNQVNTPASKVIFPVGMDSAAIRVSSVIDRIYKNIQPTIGYQQLQISVVLQNQTTVSNAYVGLAPFRSEFYLTPEQNSFELGSLRWTDQLAVHEFRHVQQFDNFNVGLSKVLHVLFGEGGQAVGNELTIPNWFFEGDAVYNETYVTKQGRGRLPYFFNGYRALWAAGKDYNWMKLRNGSYRDFIPDWYPTGYMLVSYGREKYGDDFWKKVTHDAASFDGLFYPFQKAIKNYSGVDFVHFRNDALDHYKKEFNLEHPQAVSANRSADPTQHFIADEEYPAYVNDNTLVYVKTTYDHVPVFVSRTGDVEKEIAPRDYSLDNYFDYHNGKIVYATYRPDLRWHYRDYSELEVVDINTGEETRITKDSKYFAPAFSEDGKSIVAIQITADGKSELHILDLNGKVVTVIPNKNNLFYTYPKFYGSKIIAAIRRVDGYMSIASIDPASGNTDYLLPFTLQPIVFPVVKNDKVYFSATAGKTDALFALSLTDKKLYRLQNAPLNASIGNYQAAIAGDKIAWVGFTAYGHHINQSNNSEVQWQPVSGEGIPGALPDMGITALGKGDAANLLDKVINEHIEVTKYNKAFHLLNFHTLQPTFSDPNYTLALQGENVLNTLQSQLLYNYNRNEGYSEFGFGTVYGALFPYLTAGVDYIINRQTFDKDVAIYYNELQTYVGFEIPLTFTRGHHASSLVFGSNLFYSSKYYSPPYDNVNNNRPLWYLDNFVSFSSHGRQAKKNIYPHFGESISVDFKTAINNVSANQLLVTGNLFLPGLGANHNLLLTGAYQKRDRANAGRFSNDFPFSRGYGSVNFYQVYKASANYHFPIIYPDAGVANALYILRVRGNVFYDHSQPTLFRSSDGSAVNINFRSTGAEVYFDSQLWNQFPFTIGLRYSRLLDTDIFGGNGPNRIEVVLPLSLF